MNPKMLFFFSNFFFVCVSFFIGFKVSCDTLNTFEKKREVFFLRCHVVCVSLLYRWSVGVGKTTQSID